MMIYGSIVTLIMGPVKEKQYNMYFIDRQEQAPTSIFLYTYPSIHLYNHIFVTQNSVHICGGSIPIHVQSEKHMEVVVYKMHAQYVQGRL